MNTEGKTGYQIVREKELAWAKELNSCEQEWNSLDTKTLEDKAEMSIKKLKERQELLEDNEKFVSEAKYEAEIELCKLKDICHCINAMLLTRKTEEQLKNK